MVLVCAGGCTDILGCENTPPGAEAVLIVEEGGCMDLVGGDADRLLSICIVSR